MEKLIELLNKYEKEIKKSEFYEWGKGIRGDTYLFRRDTRDKEGDRLYGDTADTYVISKKYGFIQWLVENGKIHWENMPAIIKVDGYLADGSDTEYYNMEESLLILLAISDTPIEDLCGYLKS